MASKDRSAPAMESQEATSAVEGVATSGDVSAVAAPAVAAPVSAPISDNRSAMVMYDAGDGKGPQPYRRKDLILKWWGEGHSRGAIAKALSTDTHKVTYQIVFAATKGIAGGPKKDAVTIPGSVAVPEQPAA